MAVWDTSSRPRAAVETLRVPPWVAPGIRVALAHDYLSERGGAERVVVALTRAFPGAPLYTSVFERSRFPELADVDVRPSALNQVRVLRENHRLALPLLPQAFERFDVEADVVVCSSSGWAHGINTRAPKVVYCRRLRPDPRRGGAVRQAERTVAGGRLRRHCCRRGDRRVLRRARRQRCRDRGTRTAHVTVGLAGHRDERGAVLGGRLRPASPRRRQRRGRRRQPRPRHARPSASRPVSAVPPRGRKPNRIALPADPRDARGRKPCGAKASVGWNRTRGVELAPEQAALLESVGHT